MDVVEGLAIAASGVAAGCINAIVGSGTLVTFPTLLAFGYPPVLANVSNTVGLVPGVLSAVYGYRGELRGQRNRLLRFGAASGIGGLVGAVLLLVVPSRVFKAVVPILIVIACLLVLLQPRLNRWLTRREDAADNDGGVPLWLGVLATGVYGGYFGAAQGVLLMGLFGAFLRDDMQRLNAAKNVLTAIVNGIAAVVFISVSHVSWVAAGLIAGGSVIGGVLGARIGRKLRPNLLRAVIVAAGITAATILFSRM